MEIHVYPDYNRFNFEIRSKNGKVIAMSTQTYANRRNAVSAAKLIAGSKLKVVVK
jgi:uncharacterized protein YegP (UPF0339 family)